MDWDVLNGLDQVVCMLHLANLLHYETDLDPVIAQKECLARLGLEYPDARTFVYPKLNSSQ